MCGITGIVNLTGKPVDPELLKASTDAIAHRGPDGEGHFVEEGVGLGHRRLSIIDLSHGGDQPMYAGDGRYAIVYNGEIYNFKDIRRELEDKGHSFVSSSDTEVLLHAYQEWGRDCVERLNGMFAFALYDRREKRLTLARDRYGIKPLYIYRGPSVLLFASEAKAFLSHPEFPSKLNLLGVQEYLSFQNFFSDQTLLEGVIEFPPASVATLDLSQGCDLRLEPKTFWDFRFEQEESGASDEEYYKEVKRLLSQAVKRQMVSDVDVSAYLSGGIDSGNLTAMAAQLTPNLRSFTCGFDLQDVQDYEQQFDERRAAEVMARAFGTEHYEVVVKPADIPRCIDQLVWHVEEPRVGQSYPNWYAAKLASKFNKVVLCGTGGDEIFAGYSWRYLEVMKSRNYDDFLTKYLTYWKRLLPNTDLRDVMRPVANQTEIFDPMAVFSGYFDGFDRSRTAREDFVNAALTFEAKTFLRGLLYVEDKISMAHSLESRVPFLDNDLVDFAMRLPLRLKLGFLDSIKNSESSETHYEYREMNNAKLILRKATEGLVPKEILERRKQGFSAPDASWFKGELAGWVQERLGNQSPIWGFLDKPLFDKRLQLHFEGNGNKRLLIWSLLSLDSFCRQYRV